MERSETREQLLIRCTADPENFTKGYNRGRLSQDDANKEARMPEDLVEIFEPEQVYPALAVIRPPTVSDPRVPGKESWGSGFLAHKDGLLLTAAHVLQGSAAWVWVCVWDPQTSDWTDCRQVQVRRSLLDRKIDLGLLIVPPPIPQPLTLSLDVQRGDDVVVVGFVKRSSGEGFEPKVLNCLIPTNYPYIEAIIEGSREESLRLNYSTGAQYTGVRVARGMSGGPCVDIVRGNPRVVAVAKAGMPQRSPDLAHVLSTPLAWGRKLFMLLAPGMRPDFVRQAGVCPYQGLKAFGEEEARFFFGREDLSNRLAERVASESGLVALIGPSGSGKSSIALSGLIPMLRRRRPPDKTWDAISFTPGERPFHRLADSLISRLEPAITDEVERLGKVKELGDGLASRNDQLAAVVERIIKKSKGTDRLLIIVDQFEELITITPPDDGKSFVKSMISAIGHAPVQFVLTLRADYYGHAIQLDPKLSDLLEKGVVNVGSMGRSEIESAIVKPAKEVDLDFEPGLVDRLLKDLGEEAGRLPLLEFALTQLWEKRSGRLMTHAAYEELGGLSKAISHSAHMELGTFNSEEQLSVRRIFTRLVRVAEPGQGLEDTRQRVLLKDLDPSVRPVIDKLAQARLIITSRTDSEGETVEISHEALIREWTDLQGWLNEDREFLHWRQRLRLLLAEWQLVNRDRDSLLRGALLDEAERQQASRMPDLNEEEHEFIHLSAEQRRKQSLLEVRRRRNQVRNLVVGLAITLAFATVAAVQWYRASNERRIAQARTLLSPAILIRSTQPAKFDQAALLAIESLKLDDTEEAKSLLREAITLLPQQIAQFQIDCDAKMTFSPGGHFLACLDKANLSAQVISVSDKKALPHSFKQTREIATVAASPDGQYLGLGLRTGGFRLFDIQTGELVISEGEGADAVVTFSANGKYLATAVADPLSHTTIRVFSLGGGVAQFKQFQTEYPILALTLSPEGSFLGALHQGVSGTQVTLFELTTGRSWAIQGGAAIPSLALSSGAALIALPYLDNSVAVKKTSSNAAEIAKVTHQQTAYAVAISQNGKYVASGSEDGTARVMETDTGRLIAMIPVGFSVKSLAFTADNDLVLVSADKMVRTMNVLNRIAFNVLPVAGTIGISPLGRYLTTFSGGSALELAVIDRLNGDKRWQLTVPRDLILGVIQYSRDESVFVAASGSSGMTAYDLKTQKQYRKAAVPGLLSEAISGDGQTVAWATRANIEVFRIDESRQDRLVFNNAHLLALNDDGKLVAAVGRDPAVTVFDVATKGKVFEVQLETPVKKAAFSPDGRHLAISSENKNLSLYQVSTGQVAWQLKDADATLLLFNHDGSLLATGGGQFSFDIKVIETVTGTALFRIPKEVQPVGAAFSFDGRYLDVVDETSLTRHFLRKEDLIQQTCALLTRSLGRDEWKAFMAGTLSS